MNNGMPGVCSSRRPRREGKYSEITHPALAMRGAALSMHDLYEYYRMTGKVEQNLQLDKIKTRNITHCK